MVVSVVYLPKLCITHYHHIVIMIKKSQGSKPKCSGQKVWGKIKLHMKHIKIQSFHMGVNFCPKHLIRKRQQCVHIHSNIMLYHTENVSYDVVTNVQELIFLTKKQMINIPTQVNQFVFIFII